MALPKQWNNDVALATLNPASSFAELYYPLWWYSGGETTTTNTTPNMFVQKGTTTPNVNAGSSAQFVTLNSNWSTATKFALEVALGSANSSATTSAQLYDITSSSLVQGSQVSTTSTSWVIVRSGQFTLTPGHTYGVVFWTSSGAYAAAFTDASLIIFPPSPTTSPYDVASVSLANPSGNTLKEAYIPLWMMSSGYTNNDGATNTSAGTYFCAKGTTSMSSTATSANQLYTLNSKWSSNQRFAFEASVTATSGVTTYFALWDMTSGTLVSASQISNTSTTFNLIRSGSFTLTPGHVYGVTGWCSTSGTNASLSKSHLVALSS